MDIYGLVLLTVVLVVVSALLTAALFGILFGLHKFAADKLAATNVGQLDFDNIQKGPLSDLLSRLGVVVFTPTLLLHLLEFLLVGVYIRAHPGVVVLILLVLQAAAIAAGLRFIVKLDPVRTAIATTGAALVYLALYGIFIYAYLQ